MAGSVGLTQLSGDLTAVVKPATLRPGNNSQRTERPNSLEQDVDESRAEDTGAPFKAAQLANTIAEFLDKKIAFSYDERINRIVVKVVRESTQEVIRQIPPQEMIKLMVKLREDFRGLVLNCTS